MVRPSRSAKATFDLTGNIASLVQQNREVSPEHLDRELKRLVTKARERLQTAGMVRVTGPKALAPLAPFIVAQGAQDFIDGLGPDADDELKAASDVLLAIAILHDANLAFNAVVDVDADLNRMRIRLIFAGMQLGGLDVFKAMVDGFVVRDAAVHRRQHERLVGSGQAGGSKSGAAKRAKAKRKHEDVYADFLAAKTRRPELTPSSWGKLRGVRSKHKLSAKTLRTVVGQEKRKRRPSS